MFSHKKSPLNKNAKQNSIDPGYPGYSGPNPFDSDIEPGSKKTPPNPTRRTSSEPTLITPTLSTNPFDSDEGKRTSSSSYSLTSSARSRYKNDFRDSGGVENQSVQELEDYAAYKAEETTKTVKSCLKIAENMREDATNTLVNLHQCTRRYICKNCSFSSSKPPTSFIPKLSSSSKFLGCVNPKCSWIHNSEVQSRCRDCEPGAANCTQICPPYIILYGSGTTGGIMLSETLDLPGKYIPEFLVGCSLFSSRQPAGIAGFGRGQPSLPGQLGLKKFSYCLLSHRFDDTGKSSALVLDGTTDSGKKTDGVSYTPLLNNPVVSGRRAFSVYYYVGLRKITVGGNHVHIPYKYLSPGSDGNGGTIVDSGTTFTVMGGEVFELVANEFIKQVKKYKRVINVEALTGLRPCFNVSGIETVSLPKMTFHFKGGADMELPLKNYFAVVGSTGAVCLAVVTDGSAGGDVSGGPAIILGNFQMQNFYVEYDLRNERLGFRQQSCE